MSRIEMVDLDIDDHEIQNLFSAVTAMLGRVPNSYRTLARSPLVAKMLVPFNAVVQREGAGSVLSTKLKEMVVIKTSHINQCSYWFAHNTSLGQAAGITDEQTIEIGTDEYLTSNLFSAREKAAILWATHVTLNTAKQDNGVYDEVRKEFNEQEIIDLTLICSFFNFFNRVMDSLDVPLEVKGEVDKIKSSVRLDPEKVKNYLETTVINWPESFPEPNPD
jgi:uncharacterized peroxidase-related enzyme